MKNKIIFSFLLFISTPSFVLAQNNYDFSQFWKETGLFFTQPLRWGGADWLNVGLMTAATGTAMIIEPRPSDVPFLQAPFYNSFPVTAGRVYGELYTPIALFAGYATYSLITGDVTARKIAFEIGQACLYGGAVVYGMKVAIGRARPRTFEGRQVYHPFSGLLDDAHHSLPSGHVAIGFTLSTILSMNAKPLWLKILAYVPAMLTPFSRVYQGWHWASDCVLGAGIGYFFGKWVVDMHEHNDATAGEKSAIQVTSVYPFTISIALR